VRAGYLIAADGHDSQLRQRLGIDSRAGAAVHHHHRDRGGRPQPRLRGRKASIAYLQQPQRFTILMPHDDQGKRWVFGTGPDPRHTDHPECTSVRRTSVRAAPPQRRGGGAVAAVARCRRLCATRREVFLPVQARQVLGAAC
jgi:putative polyketide hydroxylase